VKSEEFTIFIVYCFQYGLLTLQSDNHMKS